MEIYKFKEKYYIGFISVQHFKGLFPMATTPSIIMAQRIAKLVCDDNPDMKIHIVLNDEIIETYVNGQKIPIDGSRKL